jgi:hypothetical protein
MAAILSLVAGYVLGTKAGEKGLDELKSSWRTISRSPEVHQMISSSLSIGKNLLSQSRGMLADRIQPNVSEHLKSVA